MVGKTWMIIALAVITLLVLGYLFLKPTHDSKSDSDVELLRSIEELTSGEPNLESPTPEPTPTSEPVPTLSIWRIGVLDENDTGSFESVEDTGVTLWAECKDPGRTSPEPGTLYKLKDNGVLVALDETKRDTLQRFVQVGGK